MHFNYPLTFSLSFILTFIILNLCLISSLVDVPWIEIFDAWCEGHTFISFKYGRCLLTGTGGNERLLLQTHPSASVSGQYNPVSQPHLFKLLKEIDVFARLCTCL